MSAAIRQIPIDLIRPGSFQARRYFDPDALQQLAGSIRESGVEIGRASCRERVYSSV